MISEDSAKLPLPLSSTVYGVPVLFSPRGRQQAAAESGISFGLTFSSRHAPTPVEDVGSTDCLPDIASFPGRTGHLRRTGRNPLRSDRFRISGKAACYLNIIEKNSIELSLARIVTDGEGLEPQFSCRGLDMVDTIV